MGRSAHHGRTGGTASTIVGSRRRSYFAFAFGLQLDLRVDQLTKVRIGSIVAATHRIKDLGAASRDRFTGTALWSLLTAGRASIETEFTVVALASVGDSAARFAAPVVLDGDAFDMSLTGVAVGVAIAATDRTVVTSARLGDQLALTAHVGAAAHVLDREQAKGTRTAVFDAASCATNADRKAGVAQGFSCIRRGDGSRIGGTHRTCIRRRRCA